MPTTNGEFATGDGMKIGRKIGAKLVDMEKIQIHPTGFVNPKNEYSKSKILAPESLRGCGAILINSDGERFVDELTYRAKVFQAMQEQRNRKFFLLMNEKQTENFGVDFQFYLEKFLFEEFENIEELLKRYNFKKLKNTLQQYRQDQLNGKDRFGKTVFKGCINTDEKVFIAQVTPVLHYTMGGLKINENCEVINVNESVIGGLFAAGECTGGLHGDNRLVGNSLLECCVFGKIAGENAIMFEKAKRLKNKII